MSQGWQPLTTLTWINKPNTSTPLNASNLNNKVSGFIGELDTRTRTLDSVKFDTSDANLLVRSITFDSTTGIFTITQQNGSTSTIDTKLEKLAVNFYYDDDPTSPHYQDLVIELDDGTYQYIDMSTLITEYEFDNSNTIGFTITSGVVTAEVLDGSITGAKLEPNYLANCVNAVGTAQAAANAASTDALKAEGYTLGTQNGVPVGVGSPYYHNNAQWYKDQAQQIAAQQLGGLTDVTITSPTDGQVLTYDAGSGEWINADTQPGILPRVYVTTPPGSTVTVVKGGDTITATEVSTGLYEADLPEYGTYTIHALLNGDDATSTLVVDTCKEYSVTIVHFSATITVTYPAGATCTLSATGQSTQTATENPQTFTVHAAAEYTVTATDGVDTATDTVTITTDGQSESVTLSFVVIPDGSTVLPTDDVSIWLACADLSSTGYTTLAQVLADSTCLSALMADSNACDYLVRSTTWCSTVCGNASAMSYIGLNNYAANTLIADADWLEAIATSDYVTSVMNIRVPAMTSATTPSGTVSVSSNSNISTAWGAFTGVNDFSTGNFWQTNESVGSNAWCDYAFSSAVKCVVAVAVLREAQRWNVVKLQGSNDGSTWTDLCTQNFGASYPQGVVTLPMILTNNTTYTHYRWYDSGGILSAGAYIGGLQYYGREDV